MTKSFTLITTDADTGSAEILFNAVFNNFPEDINFKANQHVIKRMKDVIGTELYKKYFPTQENKTEGDTNDNNIFNINMN